MDKLTFGDYGNTINNRGKKATVNSGKTKEQYKEKNKKN